jgi:hypothetical protein
MGKPLKSLWGAIIFVIFLWGGQLAAGSDALAASILCGCVAVALLAVYAANGTRSYLGVLVLIWAGKLFLAALVVKVILLESSTSTLEAPIETGLVYLAGFTCVLGAVLLQKVLPIPRRDGVLPRSNDPRFLLVMAGVFLFVGLVTPFLTGDRMTYVGLLKALSMLRDFSILAAMYWASMRGSARPFFHPLVLGILGVCVAYGLSGTSKLLMLTPVLVYFCGIYLLTGFRFKFMYLALVPVGLVFQLIFGPQADTLRFELGQSSFLESSRIIWSSYRTALADPTALLAARSEVRDNYVKLGTYYFEANVGYLERFSLIKTGDKLIFATLNSGRTGWDTILWDLSCFPPRFLSPNKPVQNSNSELGRYSGFISADDYGTGISFGLFPHLYHALGYVGVVLLGTVTISALFWWLRCFAGDHGHLTFYGVMTIGLIHHSIAEEIYGGFIFMFYQPLVLVLALLPCLLVCRMIGIAFFIPAKNASSVGPSHFN